MTGGFSGEASSISVTGCPARTAAEYTNGLNVDPGGRRDWVTRFHFESLKSRPPTMARMLPVLASSASSDPWRYDANGPWSSVVARPCSRYWRYDVPSNLPFV